MKLLITIIAILICTTGFSQKPAKDSLLNVQMISLRDLQIITKSLKDKMTVTEWEKVTQAIDKVYLVRREEYLKAKDTAKTNK